MKNFKTFNLSIASVILRFYFMMTIVIAAGFSGVWWVGLLALPIFLSIMLGIRFGEYAEPKKTSLERKFPLKSTPVENLSNVA